MIVIIYLWNKCGFSTQIQNKVLLTPALRSVHMPTLLLAYTSSQFTVTVSMVIVSMVTVSMVTVPLQC